MRNTPLRGSGAACLLAIAAIVVALLVLVPVRAATLAFVDAADQKNPRSAQTGACTAGDQKIIVRAFQDAQVHTKAVIAAMERRGKAVMDEFDKYFGEDNLPKYARVQANFQSALDFMASTNQRKLFVYCELQDAGGEPCSRGIRAARLLDAKYLGTEPDPLHEAMVVCDPFFTSSRTPDNTKWGSMLHEVTHIAFGSVDHAYAHRAVLDLPFNSAATALINAENYRQFAEKVVDGAGT